jgi:hypothetical protein
MNGDWIDGTGLAMDGDPSHIIPLLEKIPFDVVNTGNHELYQSTVVEACSRKTRSGSSTKTELFRHNWMWILAQRG